MFSIPQALVYLCKISGKNIKFKSFYQKKPYVGVFYFFVCMWLIANICEYNRYGLGQHCSRGKMGWNEQQKLEILKNLNSKYRFIDFYDNFETFSYISHFCLHIFLNKTSMRLLKWFQTYLDLRNFLWNYRFIDFLELWKWHLSTARFLKIAWTLTGFDQN